jgi:hypothetical protein
VGGEENAKYGERIIWVGGAGWIAELEAAMGNGGQTIDAHPLYDFLIQRRCVTLR